MAQATTSPSATGHSYDPLRNIGRALVDAAAALTAAVDRRARAEGISGAQWVVLIRIGESSGKTASELCRILGHDSGAMTRMLGRLEARGLVRRAPCPADGRAALLRLTPAGEALHARLRPMATAVLDAHLRGFLPEETERLQWFLERIVANAEGRPASASCFAGALPPEAA